MTNSNQCVIATSSLWRPQICSEVARRSGWKCDLISSRYELTADRLEELNPRFIFFPHWSYVVPPAIHKRWKCVIFHMTDVPFGRGGTPLQNLVVRGIRETKMSAIQCCDDIDAGAVYLKRPLSLQGTAQDIYTIANTIIEDMIVEILKRRPRPRPQIGEVTRFSRRKPEDGSISAIATLEQVYDYIRMLDADGYPPAFLETNQLRLEFRRASLRNGALTAEVTIKKKTS